MTQHLRIFVAIGVTHEATPEELHCYQDQMIKNLDNELEKLLVELWPDARVTRAKVRVETRLTTCSFTRICFDPPTDQWNLVFEIS